VQVTVKVRPEHVAALRADRPPSAQAKELLATLRKHDASLTPLHPQATDTSLTPYFTAEVDDERAGQLLDALRSAPAVEAAYVKPADAPP
jgi:hypothetical protein